MGPLNKSLAEITLAYVYMLANEAYRYLPDLLREEWKIEVLEPLRRDWMPNKKGKMVEVNILGRAKRDEEIIVLVGESKLQLSRKYIDNFLNTRVR